VAEAFSKLLLFFDHDLDPLLGLLLFLLLFPHLNALLPLEVICFVGAPIINEIIGRKAGREPIKKSEE